MHTALVVGEDWEGLYVDGRLKAEDHILTTDRILDALGIEYEYIHVDDHRIWKKWGGGLPSILATVKQALVRGWPG